jgi:hypothetical protein
MGPRVPGKNNGGASTSGLAMGYRNEEPCGKNDLTKNDLTR